MNESIGGASAYSPTGSAGIPGDVNFAQAEGTPPAVHPAAASAKSDLKTQLGASSQGKVDAASTAAASAGDQSTKSGATLDDVNESLKKIGQTLQEQNKKLVVVAQVASTGKQLTEAQLVALGIRN